MEIPHDLRQWRKAQRAELLARRVAVPAAQRRQWNETITRLLVDSFPLLYKMSVGFYWPYQGEFDARFAIRELRERSARAALPVVVQKNAPLQFRAWWPGARMTTGVFDLPIPDGTEVILPEALLIPPVGFDPQGYRLGYGAGYFDRTLAAMAPQPLKIGVAFELSRMPTIHPQPYDVPMDFVVTEAGVHNVSKEGLDLVSDPLQVNELAAAIIQGRARTACDGNSAADRSPHSALSSGPQYSSPPCYAHEFDFLDKDA
jgi:5-formyltetrahydrofolate cyclo-ligase